MNETANWVVLIPCKRAHMDFGNGGDGDPCRDDEVVTTAEPIRRSGSELTTVTGQSDVKLFYRYSVGICSM